ncbi:MAG: molybdopterin-containing oxidoreductase family protein [Chloroflexota bacterium]
MTKLSRRTFLKLAGTGVAATTFYSLKRRYGILHALVHTTQGPVLPEETLVPGVCRMCPGGCGLVARVVDGRVVKLDGNPMHPSNQGTLCPKGQAGLQALYDPDRLTGPMRRVGERGSGHWQPIAWDEALSEVANRLKEMRAAGQPERLVFLHDGKDGPTADLVARFCQAFGTPNNVRAPFYYRADGAPLARLLSQGWAEHAAYDWENTDYVLFFGGAFLEAWQPLPRSLAAYSRLRRGRPRMRAKIVQVESRASVTATKADEWLAINPGTEGALALSIAHVIVRDDLYDAEFVRQHTFGFEDWSATTGERHEGFRSLVLRDYAPSTVAQVTGIPADKIERIAREFATARPAVAAGDVGGLNGSLYAQWAIHCLNALVGSIDASGGVLRQRRPPLAEWPVVELDQTAQAGLAQARFDGAGARFPLAQDAPAALASEIAAAAQPPEALFLYHANPLYDFPTAGWQEALARVPFIVSLAPYLDETSTHADLLLPDCSFLEKWFYEPLAPSIGVPAVALGRPIIPPLYDTRNTGDVLIALAQAVGGNVGAALPWADFASAIQDRLRGLYNSGVGMPRRETFDEFWAEFQARGVWYVQEYELGQWEQVLTTPSGRFEFYSQTLVQAVGTSDQESGPRYQPPRFIGDEGQYPLHLLTFPLVTTGQRWSANLPWLQETYGLHMQMRWENWVELNTHTAHELGIEDGALVWVESPVGRVQLKARLWEGIHPEVVGIPEGQGHTAGGRYAEGHGATPNALLAPEIDALSGELAHRATRVRVYKA